jgi:hypothetical protein
MMVQIVRQKNPELAVFLRGCSPHTPRPMCSVSSHKKPGETLIAGSNEGLSMGQVCIFFKAVQTQASMVPWDVGQMERRGHQLLNVARRFIQDVKARKPDVSLTRDMQPPCGFVHTPDMAAALTEDCRGRALDPSAGIADGRRIQQFGNDLGAGVGGAQRSCENGGAGDSQRLRLKNVPGFGRTRAARVRRNRAGEGARLRWDNADASR